MKNITILMSIIFCLFLGKYSYSQTTIYSQDFGISPITAFPTGWSSTGLTNGWNMSSSTASSVYTGATGGINVKTGTSTSSPDTLIFNGVSTSGYTNITVLWGARRTSTQASPTFEWSSDGINWYAPSASYTEVGSNSTWALVNGGTRIALPSGTEGVANLQFRWISVVAASSNYRIDDFSIEGTSTSTSSPVKLKILSVNSGTNPDSCTAFNIVVQSQDATGTAANVTIPEAITLSQYTGTASTLGGTLLGTIASGTNSATLSVTYNKVETGIRIIASGISLSSDTCSLFDVIGCSSQIAVLPTCYAWDTIIGGTTSTYPTGWIDGGTLGAPYTTGHIAPNSGKFDTQLDSLVINYNTTAGSIVYWIKGNSISGTYQFDIMESQNGITYTSLNSHTTISSSWTQFTDIPNANSRFIKFLYTIKASGNVGIDDICINLPSGAATKLAILSVNGGANPDSCTAFNVVIQSQDVNGSSSNVTANTTISLSVATGTGSLGGTISGTITAGNNSVTLPVTYSKTEIGVDLTATATAGDVLTSATSTLFNVDSCLSATLPTCYDWTPSTSYPAGWTNKGLTTYTTASSSCHLVDAGKFDTQGDTLLIHFNSNPSSKLITFYLKGSSLSGTYQFDVQESSDGSTFTTIQNGSYFSIPTSCMFDTLSISSSSNYIAFIYTLKANGNIVIDSVCIDYSTKIKSNYSNNEIEIYPNPVNNKLYLNNINGVEKINISNIFGQQISVIENINNDNYEIPVSNLPNGLYIITFYNKNGNYKKLKFIKQ